MPIAGGTVRSTDFGGLRIDYDETMLPPRAWTVAQAEWAAALLGTMPPGPVLELCAGAGHLGLLAVRRFGRPLVAVELNPSAWTHLRRNAARAGLADLVEVREGSVDAVVRPEERFALVIADPPWVETARVGRFPEDPAHTIDGGAAGLDVARQCLAVIADHLCPGGAALLQLGSAAQVEQLAPVVAAQSHLTLGEVRSFGDRGVLVRIDAGVR